MSEKSKEELSEIAKKAHETRQIKLRAKDLLCPVMELIKDGREYTVSEIEIPLANKYQLTNEGINEQLPSGPKRFLQRIGWAKWFLKKGELITSLEGAKFKINDFGLIFLKENPNFTFIEFKKIPAWIKHVEIKKSKKNIVKINSNQNEKNEDSFFKRSNDEIEDNETTKLKYDIILSAADLTTEDLNKKMIEGIIQIPKFQRDYVWSLKDASRLIDSFMMGLPIPPIFLYLQKNQKYLLIDGGQRLRTIQYFYDGIFNPKRNSNISKIFRLEGLHPKNPLLKETYDSFNDEDKQFFKNQVLRAIIIRQIKPEDSTSIYHIFERLNTGGVQLKDQEIRNCVYGGKLNDVLIELNEYSNWRLFLGKEQKIPRQKDVELILRYMTLLHTSSTYKRPMKDFLSIFMEKNKNPSPQFLDIEKKRFKIICDVLINKFGERSLHKKGSFPTAIFDCIFVALGRNFERIPDNLVDRIDRLRQDKEFVIVTTKATMDAGKIHKRIELAEKYIFEIYV